MEGDEDAPFSRSFWQDRYFHILVPTYWLKRGVCMSPTPDGSEDQQGMPLCSIPDSLVAPWLERRTQLCVGVAHANTLRVMGITLATSSPPSQGKHFFAL